MSKINPKFVYDEQEKKIGVVIDIKEFEKCIDVLEDYQDYQLIRTRSRKGRISLDEAVKKALSCTRK